MKIAHIRILFVVLTASFGAATLLAGEDDKCSLSLSQIASPMVKADRSKDTLILGLDPFVQKIHESLLKDNHIIIEGARGSGKTSAVQAFAQSLRDGRLDPKLSKASVINFNWRTAAAVPESIKGDQTQTGLTTLQQLEIRWRDLKNAGKQPIIYIDDINSLFDPEPGKALPLQEKIVDLLKRLANERVIQIVGEASRPISSEADKFLTDRFNRVSVSDLGEDQRLSILRQATAKLESKFPGVKFTDAAVLKILQVSKSMGTAGMLEVANDAAVQSYLSRADRIERINLRANRIEELQKHLEFLNRTDPMDLTSRFQMELAKLETEQRKDIEQRDRELGFISEISSLEGKITQLNSEVEALVKSRSDREKLVSLEETLSQTRLKLDEVKAQLQEARKEHRVVSLEIDADLVDSVAKEVNKQIQEIASAGKPWRVIEKPSVEWDSVVGMETAKAEIDRVNAALSFPDLTEIIMNNEVGTSLLIYGPPGNGKTMLAMAAAARLNASIMILEAHKIESMWRGKSEENISLFFDEVERRSKEGLVFVFMDEVDSIARNRSGSTGGSEMKGDVLNIMLQRMQGFGGKMSNVVFMAATNKPDALDPAFTRAGRFNTKIFIGPPNLQARTALFKKIFARWQKYMPENANELAESLAQRTEGWSGAEIGEGFVSALRNKWMDLSVTARQAGKLKVGEAMPITPELIESVFKDLSRTYPEVSPEQLKDYERFADKRAEREALIRNLPPGSVVREGP